jgi:hypothetical protein
MLGERREEGRGGLVEMLSQSSGADGSNCPKAFLAGGG